MFYVSSIILTAHDAWLAAPQEYEKIHHILTCHRGKFHHLNPKWGDFICVGLKGLFRDQAHFSYMWYWIDNQLEWFGRQEHWGQILSTGDPLY